MWQLFANDLKMLVRNRQSLFWSLAFPLMFTFIFGSFFGGNNTTVSTIAIANNSQTTLALNLEKSLKESGVFKISDEKDIRKAQSLVDNNKISAVLEIPAGFGDLTPTSPKKVNIYSDPASGQSNTVLISLTEKFLDTANMKIQNAQPIFGIETVASSKKPFSFFDYVLVGLIGMALMNSSIQGVGVAMSRYREDQIFKRLNVTPLKSWKFISAEVLSRLIINFVQVSLILIIGIYGFKAHINGSIALVYFLSLIGAILFQSIGFVVAALSKTTDAAEGMATAISIPMMFLAGVFFPIDQLPKWLASVAQYLPLAPLLREMRAVAIDQAPLMAHPSNMLIVLAWIIAMLGFSIYKFRLADE